MVVEPPPQGLLWVHHVLRRVACGSVPLCQAPWAWLAFPKGCLLPRGCGMAGEWPLVSAQGALLNVPVLPCKKGLKL